MGSQPTHDVRDLSLSTAGRAAIEWADSEMPVLRQIRARFEAEQPLAGHRVAAGLHITTSTANLIRTIKAGGAEVMLAASNILTTQDEVAAALVAEYGIATYGQRGESRDLYVKHLNAILDFGPTLIMDDAAEVSHRLLTEHPDRVASVIGGTEQTTTGVKRFKAMDDAGVLPYPVVAINDTPTKRLFDNRFGTGQSVLDGIIRATNILLAGKTVVVVGYGHCGKGIASRARGLGAEVIVTEVDPINALEATMEGYSVTSMGKAAPLGDIFVCATGNVSAIDAEHIAVMRDNALLSNAGHFDVEVNIAALVEASVSWRRIRPHVEEFTLTDGRKLHLLAEGRVVNLVAAEGHPSGVMDLSFSGMALAVEWLATQGESLARGVHELPTALDRQVASLKLAYMGCDIDQLTRRQTSYLNSYEEGA
ncbi:adenosylhomocysteinase [Actinoplanes sp. NPDC020271]|uniref:adenosylhomocysteinase n=1 Tax=Actinoplanes sp. NPDC020271 TaxID=3363896 RepID=UPI0037B3F491